VSSDLVEDLAEMFKVAIHEMFNPETAKRLDAASETWTIVTETHRAPKHVDRPPCSLGPQLLRA